MSTKYRCIMDVLKMTQSLGSEKIEMSNLCYHLTLPPPKNHLRRIHKI